MAARKNTKAAQEPKVEEQPKAEETQTEEPKAAEEEPKAEDQKAAEEEPKAEEPATSGKLVKVRNKARFDYVQPSTGIKIYVNASGPTEVKNDGWVKHFVNAGLLEYA